MVYLKLESKSENIDDIKTTILFSIDLLKGSPGTVYLLPKLTLFVKCLYCIVKNHEAHSC